MSLFDNKNFLQEQEDNSKSKVCPNCGLRHPFIVIPTKDLNFIRMYCDTDKTKEKIKFFRGSKKHPTDIIFDIKDIDNSIDPHRVDI